MSPRESDILDLLRRVRARWRTLRVLQAVIRAGLAISGVLAAALALTAASNHSPKVLIAVALGVVVVGTVALVWAFAPLRGSPGDVQVARYIEERSPDLEDRLATAVDAVTSPREHESSLVGPMIADTARRAREVDVDTIVPGGGVTRAWFRVAAVAAVLATMAFFSSGPARLTFDALVLSVFPHRVTIQVSPGNVRVRQGAPVGINARLVGNGSRVDAQVEMGDGEHWRTADMTSDPDGRFRLRLDSVRDSFKYRVLAGGVTSPTYAVTVVSPPRVTRIDVEYHYPASLGLKSRVEEDGGDVFGPLGTEVRLRIHTDSAVPAGQIVLTSGDRIALDAVGLKELEGTLRIAGDDSYRIALAAPDGVRADGETEYFIRPLDDRPPDVHIVRPAADRSVTPLEEVDIEVKATDDFGIERLELVYAVRGGAEQVVPLRVPQHATTVTSRYLMALENLDVQPGDFISYYVRARDVAKGGRGNDARSDLYFLEVKPFEQEFTLAQSRAGGEPKTSIDDLVVAQKEVLVATWKLDRRAQTTNGAQSQADVRAVGDSETELKSRVERTATSFRETTMRDPRQPAVAAAGATKAGRTLPEEDEMLAAAAAMGRAAAVLGQLKTVAAVAPEMEALNHLLKAQASVKRREVTTQQTGNGNTANANRNVDLSTLFDKELQRAQQTNFETKATTETHGGDKALLDRVQELARRQDELLEKQRDLSARRETMPEAAMRRELEQLTREQSELRQLAEDLARQDGQSGQGNRSSQRMREVADDMRNAASDLRREDPAQASAQGSKALDKLRDLEQQLQGPKPDDVRRANGGLQTEARQIAASQRQIAGSVAKAGPGAAGQESLRRLASQEEQLAAQLAGVEDRLRRAAGGAPAPSSTATARDAKAAAANAVRELDRQRLPQRMGQSAESLRAGGSPQTQAAAEQDIARALDRVADGLAGGVGDPDSQQLSDEMEQSRELREKMAEMSRELEQMDRDRSGAKSGGGGGGQGQGGGARSGGSGNSGPDMGQIREQFARQLEQARELMDQMRRQDPSFFQGGNTGLTSPGQGMALSAPGTESFKQDFSRWEALRLQATQALEVAESRIAERLQAAGSRDRLAAGADDKAPAAYQQQVDRYFKALAAKKK